MHSKNDNDCMIASELLTAVGRCASVDHFRELALSALQLHFPSTRIAWVHQQEAHWAVAGKSDALAQLPIDLAATAGDESEIAQGGGWMAIPITGRSLPAEVLLVSPHSAVALSEAAALGYLLRSGIEIASRHVALEVRRRQLEVLLELAGRWQQNQDLTDLLSSMAQAAARVLEGDRASIFLWDKPRGELVGYPALGVSGERLRIRDDQGIAGDVLRNSRPRRWDQTQNQTEINSQVGEKLGYPTRSLLAVPLLDRKNRPLGVFEVLNHRCGEFSENDQSFLTELARHAATAVENLQRIANLIESRERLVRLAGGAVELVGECPQIVALRDTVSRVSATELSVLILGENGTGKEVVARGLHLQSRRRDQPFVAVNCAAIAETLIESELFGHVKGAFTDAVQDRAGKFELASGGTLLLDEIGELSLSGQAKLLRVLEEKLVTRVGGERPIHTDVRVVAATNQDLAKLVREKRFREDLYFRLNVVTLQLPPLRERGDDVVVLAEHFLLQFAHQIGRRPLALAPSAQRRLRLHSWPGNVRELRNLMERVTYLVGGDIVEETDLAFVLAPGSSSDVGTVPTNMPLTDATEVFQRQYIQRHIEASAGNLAQAAKQLGMHRSNLYRKMSQLGMDTHHK
ncbi:MAG: sigma-54-dependent Fis family transcriptional regulator [Pirellulaceae bacterium]|nr:sigma-54-dependent Fis family transcriptional regulator [Pirellulaceae bacterium]